MFFLCLTVFVYLIILELLCSPLEFSTVGKTDWQDCKIHGRSGNHAENDSFMRVTNQH